MASHSRHVLFLPGEVRVQIKFRRTDLLYRHDEALRDPHALARRRKVRAAGLDPDELTFEVPQLPLKTPTGFAVGPSVLDMLVRSRWRFEKLPSETQQALRKRFAPKHPPDEVIAWSVRALDTLWPKPGQEQRQTRRLEDDEQERDLDHPFLASLVTGGEPVQGRSAPGWIKITKLSTCQVGEYVYRVAVGVFGSTGEAYSRIADLAVAAWEADQVRALRIWKRIQKAPEQVLVEDTELAKLRPLCSVSQEVERAVLREVCRWLGVDPDLDTRRPRGRPKSPDRNADEGEVLRLQLDEQGNVNGWFLIDYRGVPKDTELHSLSLQVLVSVLGGLRADHLDADAALLEAWLDAAAPDWRERVADDGGNPSGSERAPDPYDVLGVSKNASMAEITAAFRTTMKAVHPDTSGASAWLSRSVIEAYKQIRAAREREGPAHG